MESEVFVKIINDTLKSFGFRKQGVRRWIRTGNDISLKVYLQKSQYGDFYYLRDYYVLNKMQVKSSNDKECPGDIVYSDEELLNKMCDLENDVSDQVRETSIRALLKDAFENHQYIETEEELREMILKRLLPVFKVVLEYLKIDQEWYEQMWQAKRDASRMQSMAQIFEASPSGVYELCNKEKGFCLTYHPDGQEILIRINVFINPYTQNVDEVYQQKLDKLKYFTKVVPYENPMQEVEKIDADKANKLGFMHVELTIFDYVVDGNGIEKVKEAIFQMQEEQAPHESYVWFMSDYNGYICYFEYGEWAFKRVVIMGENGYHGFVLSEGNQELLRQLNGDFVRLESADSFELISHTAFQDIWDKTE